MTDVFTKRKRSEVMGRIRGKDTEIELIVRRCLHKAGFRFRLHKKGIPGRPDLWLPKYNAAVFVNGCYWHRHRGCAKSTNPDQNSSKWQKKFADNVARDERNLTALNQQGIRVLVVWGCALENKKIRSRTLVKIPKWLKSKNRYREIPPPR